MSTHKYLSAEADHVDEQGCVIEDGIYAEEIESPNARKVYDEWTRYWPRSKDDLKAEEAAWAARSGPCVTIKKGRTAA